MILRIHPFPGKNQEGRDVLDTIAADLRFRQECLGSEVYLSSRGEDEILYMEMWQTSEALHRYIKSELYMRMLAAIELSYEKPEMKIYEVTATEGMDLIQKLRQDENV